MVAESAYVIRRLIHEYGYTHGFIAEYINMTPYLIKEAENDYIEFIGHTFDKLAELESYAVSSKENSAGVNSRELLVNGAAVFEHSDGKLYYQPLMKFIRSGNMTLQDTLGILADGRTLPLLSEVDSYYPGITELV